MTQHTRDFVHETMHSVQVSEARAQVLHLLEFRRHKHKMIKIREAALKYDGLIFILREWMASLAGTEQDKFSKHYGE